MIVAHIMTKQGSLDNVITYEHYCDTVADLSNIPLSQTTLGSVAIVVNDEDDGMGIYIANSQKEWTPISTSISGGGSGEVLLDLIHVCSSSEYDSVTKVPTVEDAESNKIYLVPNSESGNNAFDEWIYADEAWEKFGGGSINIPVADVQVDGVSVLDAQGVATIPNAGENTYGLMRGSDIPVESGTGDKSVVTKPYTIGSTTYSNIASGACAFAEGLATTASGITSHAEGQSTTASATSSHAEGQNTNASASSAHAEGSATIASGFSSHAEGYNTQASGRFSHAEGNNTVAQGQGEHAGGAFNAISATIYSAWEAGKEYDVGDVVIYGPLSYRCKVANAENTFKYSYWSEYPLGSTLYSHIVGNGTANDARSNAYALTWTGDGKYAGDVYVHVNTDSSGGTKLATVDDVTVTDVQVNSTSVVSNGVANVPIMGNGQFGVAKIFYPTSASGIYVDSSGNIDINAADYATIKRGTATSRPAPIRYLPEAIYFGLAKLAGADMASVTGETVGVYPAAQKAAIQSMLGIDLSSIAQQVEIPLVETVTGTTPTITGQPNVRYVCGEVTSITITPPSAGSVDIIFTSGSSPAVLTLPSTVSMPVWFDSTVLDANTKYEILITDGEYGSVMSWPI